MIFNNGHPLRVGKEERHESKLNSRNLYLKDDLFTETRYRSPSSLSRFHKHSFRGTEGRRTR